MSTASVWHRVWSERSSIDIFAQMYLSPLILEALIYGMDMLDLGGVVSDFHTLRVIPPGGIGPCNNTGIALSLRYGDGTYGVDGTIVLAPVQFGSYKIAKQGMYNPSSCAVHFSYIHI